ncbi:hypothetical protein, partial [Metabacillus sediminilitoris]|uniref:hypothetical protein n=1 Tax=Metabacillus sediminilitoris TaxID=2567941 RepID=UPI001B3B2C91
IECNSCSIFNIIYETISPNPDDVASFKDAAYSADDWNEAYALRRYLDLLKNLERHNANQGYKTITLYFRKINLIAW